MEYTILDFAHICFVVITCALVYMAGKQKGASEMCEMLLDERIIKNSDLDKLTKKYDE